MFSKVLIANRGEIALRIIRACRELGIETVAVHSTADNDAMHVRLADATVCIGPAPASDSYLNRAAILAAAEISGADAIHPGYGFLAENADFAQMVQEHGLTFIGPEPSTIRLMGDKLAAKAAMRRLGVPVVPGTDEPVAHDVAAREAALEIGFPVLLKAVAGGGGRGMVVAHNEEQLFEGIRLCRREAEVGFGDNRIYVERFLGRPRHIEIQVVGDGRGHAVHLGERDCSIQRRHQKLIEEAPSPALTPDIREAIGARVVAAMSELRYLGVGTVEFLYEGGEFFFIEMNTRLQVEHPVSELVTGIDLVRTQIEVAASGALPLRQDDVVIRGHAIEGRITAEDPKTLMPRAGRVETHHPPGGPGVRVDSALYPGAQVPPYYDSLIAKLVVHDIDRPASLRRLRRALGEYVIAGVPTSIPLLQRIIEEEDFTRGAYDTRWLATFLETASP